MKENKYDEELFFKKYSEMSRSIEGLEGAGEWETLRGLLPGFEGRRVLDVGCGYGWHCLYAAQHGAESVLGTDISQKMLEAAARKNSHERITYQRCAAEDLNFPEESFDCILNSLVFHYVKDFEALVKNLGRWLTPGGDLVFTVEHPVFTSYGSQDWYRDEEGRILHFPVDRYFEEGRRDAVFLGEPVVKYHRTLTTYLTALLENGFTLVHVAEPKPPERMMELPGMRDELRRPMMLMIAARKQGEAFR